MQSGNEIGVLKAFTSAFNLSYSLRTQMNCSPAAKPRVHCIAIFKQSDDGVKGWVMGQNVFGGIILRRWVFVFKLPWHWTLFALPLAESVLFMTQLSVSSFINLLSLFATFVWPKECPYPEMNIKWGSFAISHPGQFCRNFLVFLLVFHSPLDIVDVQMQIKY